MRNMLFALAFCICCIGLYYSQPGEVEQSIDRNHSNYDRWISDQDFLPYSPSINRYVRQLWKSREGRLVWEQTPVYGIYRDRFVVGKAEASDWTIHLGLFPFIGYAMFCHELRHLWQYHNRPDMEWFEEEFDANLWAAGRCLEAGDLIGVAVSLFLAFDPLTFLVNWLYYSNRNQ